MGKGIKNILEKLKFVKNYLHFLLKIITDRISYLASREAPNEADKSVIDSHKHEMPLPVNDI